MKIDIDKKQYNRLKKFFKACYPKEGCGFLIGRELNNGTTKIEYVYIPEDQEQYAAEEYILRPIEWWIEAIKEAKNTDMFLVGEIHSHPDCYDCTPSETDCSSSGETLKFFNHIQNPIMGIMSLYRSKRGMECRLGLWPFFDKFKVKYSYARY